MEPCQKARTLSRPSAVQNLVLSALFLALGLLLPFLTGQIPQIGIMLLPMHIPVLLCGFLCGWPYGLLVGLITPLLRSLLFGMPPLYPSATAMALELASYGFFCGLLYGLSSRKKLFSVYAALIPSMILGRVIWGCASIVLYQAIGKGFTWAMFLSGAFLSAIPGVILQLVLIPPLVVALQRVSRR